MLTDISVYREVTLTRYELYYHHQACINAHIMNSGFESIFRSFFQGLFFLPYLYYLYSTLSQLCLEFLALLIIYESLS